jgi:hypothetical protein
MEKDFVVSGSLSAGLLVLMMVSIPHSVAQRASPPTEAVTLDYQFFKTRVEPIFKKKRPGHARCFLCHLDETGAQAKNSAFRLEKIPPGSTFWTEEQSRRNFDVVSALVTPSEPQASRLLIHPLAAAAGGDLYHPGGRQFASQDDPDWQTIAEWVRGQKADSSSDK